jgi:hypothetical protein
LQAKDGHSIFLDAFSVSEPMDCGKNGVCSLKADGSDGYLCQCVGNGFVGHDATDKQVECVNVTTLGKDEALAETMDVVQEKVTALETNGNAMAQEVGAIRGALNANEASVESLESTTEQLVEQDSAFAKDATVTSARIEGLQTDIVALQAGMAAMQLQLDAALVANVKLVTALKAATFSVPSVATDPFADTGFAAEINADAGGMDFVLQKDRHATVNGEPLLTAAEVQSMIQGAVTEALNTVADTI